MDTALMRWGWMHLRTPGPRGEVRASWGCAVGAVRGRSEGNTGVRARRRLAAAPHLTSTDTMRRARSPASGEIPTSLSTVPRSSVVHSGCKFTNRQMADIDLWQEYQPRQELVVGVVDQKCFTIETAAFVAD